MNLIELTKRTESLNLERNEKRLILLALIKTDFKAKDAFKLNCPEYITFDSYYKKILKYFCTGLKDLKEDYHRQLQIEQLKSKKDEDIN